MYKQPVVATHKIIVFLVFICAAIMTSLFVYHVSQKPETPRLSPNIGMMFPQPRDIKAFKLETGRNAFTEKNLHHHWTLLFFGFTHCASVCPANLDLMKRIYPALAAKYPSLQVVLISVDPERDTPASISQYTESYHPSFIGVTGKIQEIRKLQSQLGVYSAKEFSDTTNYQVQHTSSIMLINPQGKWAATLKFGLTPTDLMKSAGIVMESNHS